MKKVKKVKIITKYGYVKSIQGEVSVDIQKEHLVRKGVSVDHIYNGDGTETIFDAIRSFREDEDQLVIYSGSIIGKWNFKKMNKEMGPIPQTLYLCKGDITVEFSEWEKIDGLLGHIEAVERRNGGRGGKPDSVSLKDHKRIHKMRDDGMNSREICEALGWDKERKTTVWRWAKKVIAAAPPKVPYEGKE